MRFPSDSCVRSQAEDYGINPSSKTNYNVTFVALALARGFGLKAIGDKLKVQEATVVRYAKAWKALTEGHEDGLFRTKSPSDPRPNRRRFASEEELERNVLLAVRREKTISPKNLIGLVGFRGNVYVSRIGRILNSHGIGVQAFDENGERLDPYQNPVVLADPSLINKRKVRKPTGNRRYDADRSLVVDVVLEEDPITLKNIDEVTGLTRGRISDIVLAEEFAVVIPRRKNNPIIDGMVEKGLTDHKIVQALKRRRGQEMSLGGVRAYIKRWGLRQLEETVNI